MCRRRSATPRPPATYEFNKDRQLTRIAGPGGEDISWSTTPKEQLETVTLPAGQLRIAFDPKTDQLKTLQHP